MRKRSKPLVVGNWKMNPATVARAEKLWLDIQKGLSGRQAVCDIAVAPPLAFLNNLKELASTQKIDFISQDVSKHESGAHTGEVSIAMLRSLGIKCSIVGHSERRLGGETDNDINQKLINVIKAKSTAILCVGETERDNQGNYFTFIEEQIKSALTGVSSTDLRFIIIAYEPVWAIGTGNHATPSDIEEMRLFINKVLSDLYDRAVADKVRILYGGSVSPLNAEDILEKCNIDGFLVGGASLEAKQFVEIVKMTDTYAKSH